jgi:hypothetical protein
MRKQFCRGEMLIDEMMIGRHIQTSVCAALTLLLMFTGMNTSSSLRGGKGIELF